MKDDEMDRARNTHGELTNAYIILVGKPTRKIPLANPKADIKEVE
jgi:hypothetical protein